MNNWYTVAIAFLGGTALGLLGFLFIQPVQSGHSEENAVTNQDDSQSSSAKNVESDTSEKKTEPDKSSPSVKEKWEGETATTSAIPQLIFYYKPG